MHIRITCIVAASAALLLGASRRVDADPITDLYNTGVDNAGALLGDSVNDPHYTITVDPQGAGDATVPNDGFPIPPWLANDANSRWIGPATDHDANGAAGDYTYRTTFTLPANANLASVSITGNWATDDGGLRISLNGTNTNNPPSAGFSGYTAFTINDANADFVVGTNTLDFTFNNGGGPTGLRVDDMTGTFTVIPEPAALSLIAVAGAGLLGNRRRSSRR